ncbi:hypothetical protein OKW21_000209 [Catalinimonas alkaloidigena]|uniref:hypothetical protein n=1 Tax=Catalinimonas alkaloidigena TaxID=1075417 RepID=UPI002406A81E|nr:hypothetical protein [Catalinimonas alkaloidigena]MDF9794946.1 hypothetical protein [Catalinimonas alkaloidigena]
MRYLTIIFLFCCIQSNAQITGNPYVKDSSAIKLDTKAVNTMIGKWKLVRTEDHFQNEERVSDRGMIVDFEEDGAMISSWCVDCHQEILGQWQVLNEQTIKFDNNRAEATKFLAGEWAVYKLTEQEMILAKVLTSSGNWKKFQYYSRDIGNLPVTEVDPNCINCLGDSWCFGDRPEEAKRQYLLLNDLLRSDENQHQHSAEIQERYDWLLNHAPCINTSLYINAVKYYEGLLQREKNEQVAKSYREKIKQIKEQQLLYFTN